MRARPIAEATPTEPAIASEAATKQSTISLDQIAGASVQEVHDLLAGRSRREIASLARQLENLPFGARNGAKVDLFFQAWAQLAPRDALQTALSFRKGWTQTRALEAVFESTAPADAAALVNSLAGLPAGALSENLRVELIGKGVSLWSRADPAAAAGFLGTRSASGVSDFIWNQVADNWAAQDPASALEWLQKQDPSRVGDAMQGLLSGWWQKDPEATARFAAAHVDTLAGQQTASIIANRMADENPKEAIKWAAQLPNDLARRMSEMTAAVGWAANDPRAASEWAAGLPAADQEAVVGGIASRWAENDPQAAAEWINQLQGSARDGAAASYSSVVARTDPEAALAWALSVSDPSLRDATARHIASDWLTRDPAAAAKWIQNSALPDSDKAQLLSRAQPTP